MDLEQLRTAVSRADRVRLPDVAALLWKMHAAGLIPDDDAQALAEQIEARKRLAVTPKPRRSVGARPRSPASIERRRAWAAGGWLPPAVAARFTAGEQAALAVVLCEIEARGRCELPHGAIAARAGVGLTVAKSALRQGRRLGLLDVKERRQSWCRNLPNLVAILSRELSTWVRLRARKIAGGGVGSATGTTRFISSKGKPASAAPLQGKSEGRFSRGDARLWTDHARPLAGAPRSAHM